MAFSNDERLWMARENLENAIFVLIELGQNEDQIVNEVAAVIQTAKEDGELAP